MAFTVRMEKDKWILALSIPEVWEFPNRQELGKCLSYLLAVKDAHGRLK